MGQRIRPTLARRLEVELLPRPLTDLPGGAVEAAGLDLQPRTAVSAALNVLLGRITAVVMSLSGA
jgi:hypothetical protein